MSNFEFDMDTELLLLMAKKIKDLSQNETDSKDSKLISQLTCDITTLAQDNFELRKQHKSDNALIEELRSENAKMQKDLEKARKWKKQLNSYREKYEMMRYGYIHGPKTKGGTK